MQNTDWDQWVDGLPPQLDALDFVLWMDGSEMILGFVLKIFLEELYLRVSETLGEFATVF